MSKQWICHYPYSAERKEKSGTFHCAHTPRAGEWRSWDRTLGFRFQPVLSPHQLLLICPSTELTKNKNEMEETGMHPNRWWGLKGKQEGCVFVSHTFKLSDWFSLGMPCFCVFFLIFFAFCLCHGACGNLSSPTRDQPLPPALVVQSRNQRI